MDDYINIPFQDFTPSNIISDIDFEKILNNSFNIIKKKIKISSILSTELQKISKNNNKEYYNKALERWKSKKKYIINNNKKKVVYISRSIYAKTRPRVGGRFVQKYPPVQK